MIPPTGGYERGVLRGIARYSRLHGPWIFKVAVFHPELPFPGHQNTSLGLFARSTSAKGARNRHVPDLRKMGATGFIGRIQTAEMAQAVLNADIPTVAMDLFVEQLAADNPLSRLSELHPDSFQAGRLAAEHLLECNLRNFAFCGHLGLIWSDQRGEGFRRRLEAAGFSCDVYQPSARRSSLPWDKERPLLLAWLRSLSKPVGVMACNDIRGIELLEACLAGDIMVPDDVAIIGVDEDRLLCDVSHPTLSSVMLDSEQGGYQAAELLDSMMRGDIVERRTLLVEPLWVVPRCSTDLLAVEDREVAEALRFIRENSKKQIGVGDVARQVAMSRRSLEIRFQHVLGRSIRSEIERGRLVGVKQLLVETDLPAWKVAEMAGFNRYDHASKVFRREVGKTMKAYRRDHRTP